ncbi:ATP-binding protein [Tuwongella immobilis]|uniref:Probable ferredoxin MJ0251-putative Fe-S containing oxidoreductase n=1 Tax=Tuwongella immobilis TaxID=692036 RepID=A0A6C2YTG3_9BACT|nr:ferredoxin family protein [Tuwongella immobilis]VIP04671.1 Probable ferredoxin MJ0251-putative Fe-S containing oxidoreductase OS=Planctomyces maris DSM 8797 GN=PM8797T_19944 PE=4 SV=1 [Tuwongella immobilis]VTS06702.1 Probable ferredoxin MJ0251-putative Fe-S containing oxidoreductase OS=Planctomyces maris DSM 8797 GN=PM8797T_19944 PE=4 SV=1 [Tuwongella immobilis]
MSRNRITVVLSQAPGKHPAKRSLEESIAAAFILEPSLEVSIIPNLYDLDPQHTGRLFLESVRGDMVVLSWLYPRAAFWLLDRIGIRGHFGETLLKSPNEDADEEETEAAQREKKGVGPSGEIPDRHIYTLDLRDAKSADAYLKEVRRIAEECEQRRQEKAKANPVMVQLGLLTPKLEPATDALPAAFSPDALLAPPNRRWYPVIDYSRCTNCMECLDFCLFGVYGLDSWDKILVENQDNCKKGCPACSRVCPEQAIMFPEYKSPAIAGADTGAVGGLKIDLTRLFGGESQDAVSQAVAERDAELVKDGRNAVGTAVGLPKRQTTLAEKPKDDLDQLMDDLDALGL